MHWNGLEWGIELVADNRNDEILLKAIASKLPSDAKNSYESGELATMLAPSDTEGKGFTITLHR